MSKPQLTNPTNEQELREQLLREIAFYGDMCAQHQSTLHFGKFTVDQRNAAIRKSIYSHGLPELIQAHTNAEIAKVLDRLEAELNEQKKAAETNLAYHVDVERLIRDWQGTVHGIEFCRPAIAAERAKLKEEK